MNPNGSSFIRSTLGAPYGRRTPLQDVILGSANSGTNYVDRTEISASLQNVANAVEYAFVLVPREALPKIGRTSVTTTGGSFTTASGQTIQINDGSDSAKVREVAATWLAVAALLEAEETEKAAEAKRKADEAKAALEAEALRERLNRLEELATEWFDEPYDYLGAKKKAAVEEIYRLEGDVDAAKECCGCDE